jgi:flagellar basal body-associated protein FliL
MKKSDLNTILLIIIIVLLIICAYGIYSRPTLDEIDRRIMHWGQHFGQQFSN